MNIRATDFRSIGDVPRSAIIEELSTFSSPMLNDFDSTYRAAQPHTALFFAMARKENLYKTTGLIIKPEHNNPVGLRPERPDDTGPYGNGIIVAPDESQFLSFPSDAHCAREWARRLFVEAATYKGGVYANARTLGDLLAIYTPPGDVHPLTGVDNATIDYVGSIMDSLHRYELLANQQEQEKEATVATVPALIQNYQPRVIDKWLNVAQDGYGAVFRYHSRGGMTPKIIVIHVQEGSNWGSWQHFHVVTASSTVLIGKNGEIWRIVSESVAPWTNGDVRSPSYFMKTILNRWGWDPNTYSLTIEREGFSRERFADQDKSIVWQVWQWMKTYAIEAIYIIGHYEVNSETRPSCPDPAPHPLVTMVKGAVSGSGVPVIYVPDPGTVTLPGHDLYRDPWPVMNEDGSLWTGDKDIVVNGIKFYAEKGPVLVGPDGVNRRQWASADANMTGPVLTPGTTFLAYGWVEGAEVDGERRWWIGSSGSRVWVGGTTQKPRAVAPVPTVPDELPVLTDKGNNRNAIPVVLNGNTYYPVESHDPEGKIRRPARVLTHDTTGNPISSANVRLWAATHDGSPVIATYAPGTTMWLTHWVRGQAVDIPGLTNATNRDIWYVIEHTGGDAITKGGRIWSGLIELI